MIIVVNHNSFIFDRYNMSVIKCDGYHALCLYEKSRYDEDRTIIYCSYNEYDVINKFNEIIYAYKRGNKIFKIND